MSMTKSVKLGAKTVSVRELTLQEIHDLTYAEYQSEAEAIVSLVHVSTGLEHEDLMTYAPSELAELVDSMLEVNKSFFDQAAAIQAEKVAVPLERMIKAIFTLAFLPLSKRDTVSAPGIIPTPSS